MKAARRFSSPPWTRGAPRARCNPARPSTCSTVCCRGRSPLRGLRSAPCSLQPRRGARLGRLQPGARARLPPPSISIRDQPTRDVGERGRAAGADPISSATFETNLVMSHLACADEPGRPHERAQRHRFNSCAPSFRRRRRAYPTRAVHFSGQDTISISSGRGSRSTADVRTKTSQTPCDSCAACRQDLQVHEVPPAPR